MGTALREFARHNQFQCDYYEGTNKPKMRPTGSPYLRRHVAELMREGKLLAGDRVLEVGCGMGRYTLLLAELGLRVEAMDMSAWLLERLDEFNCGRFEIPLHCCDLIEHPPEMAGRFDAVVGFFMLHHVHDLDHCLAGMRRLVRPGGKVLLLEPNPFNPLYYPQILLTPGMKWQAERGMLRMRRRDVFPAFHQAGLCGANLTRFGFFPPFLANRGWGRTLESLLERFPLWQWMLPFQIFSATRPE
jgi:2-polyprenyl-3-methyl-5-hydroxy-6-metoxy-1,4-benzoquinol methylase